MKTKTETEQKNTTKLKHLQNRNETDPGRDAMEHKKNLRRNRKNATERNGNRTTVARRDETTRRTTTFSSYILTILDLGERESFGNLTLS
jgi:hypothetical protein